MSKEIIASQASSLLTTKLPHVRLSDSLAVGDTVPDLVIAACFPEVFAFTGVERIDAHILAYLRAVRGGVRQSTIAERIGYPEDQVEPRLRQMEVMGAVRIDGGLYFIAWAWRLIVPEIVTIDMPGADTDSDWDAIIRRASRNRAFAHRTYIALPAQIAESLQGNTAFRRHNAGLLALNETDGTPPVRLVRSPSIAPLVWLNYYQAALALSRHEAP